MKKRTYKPFSPNDIKSIREMNDKGMSNAEIAQALGRTAAQIAQKKFHLGIKQKPKPGLPEHREKHKRRWTIAEVDKLRQMRYKHHMSIGEISRELGRSDISIQAKLRGLEKELQAFEETSILWGMFKFKYPVQ